MPHTVATLAWRARRKPQHGDNGVQTCRSDRRRRAPGLTGLPRTGTTRYACAFLCMRLLVLVALTSIAHADARQDIVDIRHRRMPNHTDVLGWTADGAFVLRRTTCEVQDLSDIPSCGVSIDVASTTGTASHGLFGATWAIDCV